ncbi:predicted protein [Histoplasma capsulatum var. duboisii H88]|uniref:Predicted protein n=1 Tax=Ajellomyces capsulatus (strain H88) TaxID=544711 RepID=F0UPT7_AJEC8|nr:predicted protein [Histoplasma capsulatum var. duboisii H88]
MADKQGHAHGIQLQRQKRQGRENTQIIANATSVTLNRLSTSQSAAAPLTIAAVHPSCQKWGLIRSSSAKNVKAQRKPHHVAGRTLRPRQSNKGIYQRRSTPRITATRGWSENNTSRPSRAGVSDGCDCWEGSADGEKALEDENGGGESFEVAERVRYDLSTLRERDWGCGRGAWREVGGVGLVFEEEDASLLS